MKVFLFAFIAAIGNALFVYGQRGSNTADNPFFFLTITLMVCIALFIASALIHKAPIDPNYVMQNLRFIIISGIGFFITFTGFYWLYSEQGATGYMVYALLSILTTSIGVGLVIFREPYNRFHIISGVLAVSAILFYGLGQSKLPS